MMFYTHLAFSVLFASLWLRIFPSSDAVLFIALAIFFGALPDIDTSKSKIGRKFPLISTIIGFFFGHRGIFHTVYIPILLFVLSSYYFGFSLSAAILVGYISHLIGDALTIQGIKPFQPLHNMEIRGFMATGSIAELVLLVMLLVIDANLVFRAIG
ncbi:MAG TPA: metal-dependent hydrolase [Candidatus Nanoarchaeia archaeon]|nr:metal-dependent hydrolase [Candidatus Nanoarchaeia archaeon]